MVAAPWRTVGLPGLREPPAYLPIPPLVEPGDVHSSHTQIGTRMPSGPEALIVLAIIILLFGAKKLPELAGSVGKSIKEFRKESKDAMSDDEQTASTSSDDEV